MPAYEPPP
jgi:hypothetical protein